MLIKTSFEDWRNGQQIYFNQLTYLQFKMKINSLVHTLLLDWLNVQYHEMISSEDPIKFNIHTREIRSPLIYYRHPHFITSIRGLITH